MLQRSYLLAMVFGAVVLGDQSNLQAAPPSISLKIGTTAPDFSVKSRAGEQFELARYKGQKWVVLVFSPSVFSPEGKAALASYESGLKKLSELGAETVLVTSDTPSALTFWGKDGHNSPVTIISDSARQLIPSYGVQLSATDLVPVSYLIDKNGQVREVFQGSIGLDALALEKSLARLK